MKRLGKNHNGYHGETINIHEVLRELQLTARKFNWQVEPFYAQEDFQWFALHRKPAVVSTKPFRIYLSTGIHGDEPAGPLAAFRLIQADMWPAGAEIFLLPCLNPAGFARNTRENAAGLDLNRDYLNPQSPEIRAHIAWLEQQPAFDLCLCLHEDWESHGFYLYELNPDRQPSWAERITAAVAQVCPLDHSEIIEGREAHGGIIRPNLDPRTRPLWPESFWLLQHKTRLSYTLEAPSDFPLETRVNALVTAVKTVLA
jgi:predicted deacylase